MPSATRLDTTPYFFSRGEDDPSVARLYIVAGDTIDSNGGLNATITASNVQSSYNPDLTELAVKSYVPASGETFWTATLSQPSGTFVPTYLALVLINENLGTINEVMAFQDYSTDIVDTTPITVSFKFEASQS